MAKVHTFEDQLKTFLDYIHRPLTKEENDLADKLGLTDEPMTDEQQKIMDEGMTSMFKIAMGKVD